MKHLVFAVLLLVIFATAGLAEPATEADIPVRHIYWEIGYDVNADGSYVETQKWSSMILKENAVEKHKEASVTFSTSVAKGEIVEAYTLKKSGKRIDAPKSSYQVTTNNGYNSASPLYSDETTISVVFPDLAVGDTTVFESRVTNSEGIFPGQFSMGHVFSRFSAYDDVRIRINTPKAMTLKSEAYFLTALAPLEKDGKLLREWRYKNEHPEKWTPAEAGISTVEDEPGLYVSTFENYRQIAEAYGKRATPKAAVSGRIKALAAELASGKTTPEAQARSLYDWVAKNISYGGNCIGVGTVVPRDLDVVLDNKLGDCKDHATLLQALLAARGIRSEQALVNAGSRYDLPKTPVVSAVNHVINYVPELKLFLDSTASFVPFGMLPVQLGEKPVLLVSSFRDGERIPTTATYGHSQTMKTIIRVKPDGSAEGTTHVTLKGMPALGLRTLMRFVTNDQEALIARKLLEEQGLHGTAVLKKDDPNELLDSYGFSISFNVEDLLTVSSTSGMTVRPVVSSPFAISSHLTGAYEPPSKRSSICAGGKSIEEYTYEFPAELSIVAIPKNTNLPGPILKYSASYQKDGNKLTVKRELQDTTANNICSTSFMEDYKKNARAIVKDVRSQILISN